VQFKVSLRLNIRMETILNGDAEYVPLGTKNIYQDARNTSSHWRQQDRILHPLTERQFGNRFRVGDRVRMQLRTRTSKIYITLNIAQITTYDTAKQWLHSYNADNTFKGVPFTQTLVLRP